MESNKRTAYKVVMEFLKPESTMRVISVVLVLLATLVSYNISSRFQYMGSDAGVRKSIEIINEASWDDDIKLSDKVFMILFPEYGNSILISKMSKSTNRAESMINTEILEIGKALGGRKNLTMDAVSQMWWNVDNTSNYIGKLQPVRTGYAYNDIDNVIYTYQLNMAYYKELNDRLGKALYSPDKFTRDSYRSWVFAKNTVFKRAYEDYSNALNNYYQNSKSNIGVFDALRLFVLLVTAMGTIRYIIYYVLLIIYKKNRWRINYV